MEGFNYSIEGLNNYFKNVKLMFLRTFNLMKKECKSYTVFYASKLTYIHSTIL